MTLYKFLPKDYVEAFLDGQVFCRSLSDFQQFEDRERGDHEEGVRVYRPPSLIITKSSGETLIGRDFASTVRGSADIFVFCMSESGGADVRALFKDGECVAIHDVKTFLKRVRKAVRALRGTRSAFSGRMELFHDTVRYYERAEEVGASWRVPKLLVMQKEACYRPQKEHRLAFARAQLFAFDQANRFVTMKKDFEPVLEPPATPVSLEIGSIRDIAREHPR